MTIYPTYLYIKQHSVTGLKYFGKTTKDPLKYNGSGKRWLRHLKKHGTEHVITIWVSEPYIDSDVITEFALTFSIENNIVESKDWANLMWENGLDGGGTIDMLSNETIQKMSNARKGTTHSAETRQKMSDAHKGKPNGREGIPRSAETRQKISNAIKGVKQGPHSDETKQKISDAKKGKPQPKITCPHCSLVGSISNMKHWHFDNCKKKPI